MLLGQIANGLDMTVWVAMLVVVLAAVFGAVIAVMLLFRPDGLLAFRVVTARLGRVVAGKSS